MVKIILLSGEQNHRCCYCGNSMIYHDFNRKGAIPPNAMTRDHVIPKSYGGCGYYQNIVIACRQCNSLRGNVHAHIFYQLIERWKKRNPDFAKTWYSISREEHWRYKMEVLFYQSLHLKSRRRESAEDSERYERFSTYNGKYLSIGRETVMPRNN